TLGCDPKSWECFLAKCFVGERRAKTWPPLKDRQWLFNKNFFGPMILSPTPFRPITPPSYNKKKNLLISDFRLPSRGWDTQKIHEVF
ncbi:LOW QUALITY PROTEIN: hypothetical protein PanWU01x14_243900, partial [Parasponia andersonii]